jgi:hypothetical protein
VAPALSSTTDGCSDPAWASAARSDLAKPLWQLLAGSRAALRFVRHRLRISAVQSLEPIRSRGSASWLRTSATRLVIQRSDSRDRGMIGADGQRRLPGKPMESFVTRHRVAGHARQLAAWLVRLLGSRRSRPRPAIRCNVMTNRADARG